MPRFATVEPISAVIELVAASICISAGDRTDTVVDIHPSDSTKRADVEAAEQVRVDHSPGRVLIQGTRRWRSWNPFGFGGSVDVQVELPAGSRVSGNISMGAFRSTGPLGDSRIKTSLADIHIERASAIRLATAAGEISVGRATGDAELIAASGDISVGRADGAALLKASNGDIRAVEVAGELRAASASGDIVIEAAHASATLKTAKGDIRVGTVGPGSVVAETGVGTVEIGVRDGLAAWLDLRTGFGQLTNALDAGDPPGPGVDTVRVRARSGYGDIRVGRLITDSKVATS